MNKSGINELGFSDAQSQICFETPRRVYIRKNESTSLTPPNKIKLPEPEIYQPQEDGYCEKRAAMRAAKRLRKKKLRLTKRIARLERRQETKFVTERIGLIKKLKNEIENLDGPDGVSTPIATKETRRKKKKNSAPNKKIKSEDFYFSREWRELRYRVLRKYGTTCMLCGVNAKPAHVDHIKPKIKYPELALNFNNLQVLCEDCNIGKSYKYEDDFRPKNNS